MPSKGSYTRVSYVSSSKELKVGVSLEEISERLGFILKGIERSRPQT